MGVCTITTIIDVETTIFQKGNPFARRNKLCYLGVYREGRDVCVGTPDLFSIERTTIDDSSRLVLFNAKFDLHWLRRHYGWTPSEKQRIWDCQLAHFLLQAQRRPYPSLEDVAKFYGIAGKLSGVRELWDRGIDTPNIPQEMMLDYLKQDLLVTMEIYQRQLREFKTNPKLFNLFKLSCEDLLVLAEMEWYGLNFDTLRARQRAVEIRAKINRISYDIANLSPTVPINLDSPEHVSCLLYGGIIKEHTKRVEGIYKSGIKAGQPKYRNIVIEHVLPRQVEPIDGSELKKPGYWSTDESILRQLQSGKGLVSSLVERAKLAKELDYMDGIPNLISDMDWEPNQIHGVFNQCVAATGRLSSSKPNEQNFPEEVKRLIKDHK